MNNPICNTVFYTLKLIDYKDYLAEALVDNWNSLEETRDLTAYSIEDIFSTSGYEFANNAKEAFEVFEDEFEAEITEYKKIATFCEEMSNCSDFYYGETVIHEDYFTEYTEEMLKDCGYFPKDIPSWIVIDFEATAENVKQDYSEFMYEGDRYYIRS